MSSDKSKKTINLVIRLLCIAVAVLLCAFMVYFLWKNGTFLPRWIIWNEKSGEHTFTDLPGRYEDPNREAFVETVFVSLKNRRFSISDSDGNILWESEKGWRVSDYILDDIDHDGEDEVVILFWRRGSFGPFKPFWIEKDEKTWSQHIGIYDYDTKRGDRIDPIWVSSRMGIKAKEFRLDEKEYLHIITPEGKDTLWFWNTWGLMLVE